jgi:hypothetical protein
MRKFSPYQFLRLGRSLAKATSESRMRTGAGRLYYANHWKARTSLVVSGFTMPKRAQHHAVIQELRRRRHPNAEMLDWLYSLRIHADYDLAMPFTSGHALYAVALANHIYPKL